ncbi:hypothetical protein Deipr_0417 [Deinococcus proteolyticus MRP]|uniref:Uncharacterized protein n=1 Tax=Deinococcus proteolyticus (strain ATCC 35074 / DSM 20540 / JCM 6276 / NBRC 101906 / NCIMB 13154 / VKM Ac-1939 / CCM 2703 / MRP) TaxID=693977 RepID=F0RJW1_DEIPM|nr:hypothetical protein Deipr_0417 [Deinococcus proteolyticus MRP]
MSLHFHVSHTYGKYPQIPGWGQSGSISGAGGRALLSMKQRRREEEVYESAQ